MFNKIRDLISQGSLDGIILNPDNGFDSALAIVVIMIKVATSDGEFDSRELVKISENIKENLGVNDFELGELISLAEEIITKKINTDGLLVNIKESFNIDQKQAIIAMAWKITLADDKVDKVEAITVRDLAKEIGLNFEQAVRARQLAEIK